MLVALFKALKPDVVLEKLNPLWQHKSWKVKHGLLEVIAEVGCVQGRLHRPLSCGGRLFAACNTPAVCEPLTLPDGTRWQVASTTGVFAFINGRDQNSAVLKQIVRMVEEPDM